MTFLPIVARELRVASRRRGAWLTRVSAAFIGIAIGTFLMLAETGEQPAQLGKELFATVACFLFIYVTIAGALVTCDCLSEEKREGTMGLLFLTDLKGYDVVLGKLAATSLNTIYGMLAVVPLMAIPILLGGVASAEFWHVVIVATNLLMFSLSVGIVASSVSRSDHRAMLLSFVLIAILILGPWLLSMYGWGRSGRPIDWLVMLSPAVGCFTAFDAPIRNPQVRTAFWTNAACTQIYFWLFILIACRVVPRSWQEAGERFQSRGVFAMLREILEGRADARAARRRRMLDVNPYFWRAARKRTKDLLVWILIIGTALFWLSTRPSGDAYFDVGRDIFVIALLHAALKWWVTAEACRHLSDDRRSGGLELLLSTPLREEEIVGGQRRALMQQFGGPVAVVLVADFIFMLMTLKLGTPDERSGWVMVYLILGGFLAFDLFTLSTVGMWLGVSGRKTNRATIVALMRIIVLPTAVFTVAGILIAIVRPNGNPSLMAFGVFWIVLCTVTNLVFIASAKNHLRQFRDIVAQRFATKVVETPVTTVKAKPPQVAIAK
jgi:hypothetical protein